MIIGHSMGGLVARHFIECREGLAGHPRARHDRDAVRGLAQLARDARQRQEDQVLRPHRDRAVADGALPAAPDLPLLRRGRRQARAGDRGADPEARRREGGRGARVPRRDPHCRRGEHGRPGLSGRALRHPPDRRHRAAYGPVRRPARRPGRAARRRGKDDLGGDGTVPRPSATPAEYEKLENAIYAFERHASLQNDGDVLNPAERHPHAAVLQPGRLPRWVAEGRAVAGHRGLGDAGAAARSPRPSARRSRRPPGRCRGERRDGRGARTSAAQGGRRRRRWLSAELDPLPEGLYRISSIGGSIEPVTDLVTVVAE